VELVPGGEEQLRDGVGGLDRAGGREGLLDALALAVEVGAEPLNPVQAGREVTGGAIAQAGDQRPRARRRGREARGVDGLRERVDRLLQGQREVAAAGRRGAGRARRGGEQRREEGEASVQRASGVR